MMRVLAIILTLLPGLAAAEDFPALFDVTGVASNDVLNVRAEPRAGADKIGELAHDARDVEVIRTEGGWGLVNVEEWAGWTSLRYLARQAEGDYALTRQLQCFGTEPFWSLEIEQGRMAMFSTPESDTAYPAGLLQSSFNRTDRFSFGASGLLAVIGRTACSDGMSDQEFGLTIDLWPRSDTSAEFYSGCCSLTGN